MFIIAGCLSGNNINFHGDDLKELEIYKFTLTDQYGDEWSLADQKGKIVVVAFIYTSCDDVCLAISSNLKWIKKQLTESELENISFVSVTIDWKNDSPSVLENWSNELGLDWPHLTDWNSDELQNSYYSYNVEPYDEEKYQELHLQPTYILDTELNARVMWNDFDWPVDLFLEDLRTVIKL
jgi:protein SCO1/2